MISSSALSNALGNTYKVSQQADTLIVVSPFAYDDGDPIVVFITEQDERLQLDDNGETATRLMFEGYDLDNKRTGVLLHSLKQLHGIHWDDDAQRLFCFSTEKNLSKNIFQLIQDALQMQGLSAASKH